MEEQQKNETDWRSMNHIIPDGFEKYVVMLAEAGSAKNELILVTRFQKVVRAIYDECVALKGEKE